MPKIPEYKTWDNKQLLENYTVVIAQNTHRPTKQGEKREKQLLQEILDRMQN